MLKENKKRTGYNANKNGWITLDLLKICCNFSLNFSHMIKGSFWIFQIDVFNDAKEFFKKHNSKLRKLYLLTHADNERAHKFYEKMGLKRETTLKDHYYKNKDEYVFSMFFD